MSSLTELDAIRITKVQQLREYEAALSLAIKHWKQSKNIEEIHEREKHRNELYQIVQDLKHDIQNLDRVKKMIHFIH